MNSIRKLIKFTALVGLCLMLVDGFNFRISNPPLFKKHMRMTLADSKSDQVSFEKVKSNSVPGKSWFKCKPLGIGSCASKNIIQNQAFESLVDTNDAWIAKRTGIKRRHTLETGVSLRDLSINAAKEALSNANVDPLTIDLVIIATSSPDDLFGDAAYVANAVGAKKAAAFDLTAACSGFVFGMVTAAQYLQTGAFKRVLLIGSDALARFLDWNDRGTCILFGDASGAMVLDSTQSENDSGILGFALHSDGDRYPNLKLRFEQNFTSLNNVEKTIVDQGNYGKLQMNGPEVYKFAVNEVPDVIQEALKNAGLAASNVDWLLLHQANIRIMEHAAKTLGISMDKVLKNIEEYGNTSAASIPLALAEAVKQGKIKKGDIIAVSGFGAGLSWGAAIIRW